MNKHIETPEDPVGPKTQRPEVENSLTARTLKKMEQSSDDRMDRLMQRLSTCWKQAGEAPIWIRPVALVVAVCLVVLMFTAYITISIYELKLSAPELLTQFKKVFIGICCVLVLLGGTWAAYVSNRFDQPHDRPVPIQDKANR